MNDSRTYLHKGTIVTLESGDTYEITGAPVGCGGGSVIYPAERLTLQQDRLVPVGIYYVLKECYPVSYVHSFVRAENGEIRPVSESPDALDYLSRVRKMQLAEKEVTQHIYRTGSRLLPILDSSGSAKLTYENRSFLVRNVYTVMESLAAKGKALSDCVEEYEHLTSLQAFHITRQILFALREIHQAGYLHLDLQGGNIFIKGTLADESDILTLIDFGSARKLTDGKTAPVADRVIFTTQGFSAPEILLHNDGTLCLTPGADIYSVGCLLLYMLTGEQYDTGQLIRNTSGRYLSNFKLRKIDCPRHLVDRMQRILSRALAVEPSDRYHTADEMLSEVSDFIKALRPKDSAVAAVAYDAFICYRHGKTDSRAALALQKNLEHFRPPRGLLRGSGISSGRAFQRVFIDEGELSSCADMGGQIREALKNSAWLIVICSPATPGSPWVKEEIDTFLQYHDRSRILAILTEGEPEVSFPDRLLAGPRGQTEVLAADARGKDLKDILKRLRGDALLKLAAPMLGTTYDSLKQRHKMRLLQQITAAACMVMAITGAFLAYAVRQNHRIQEELTHTKISESRYLAKQSEEALTRGQRFDAIRTALSALPENSEDKSRPVVPEAVAALKNAVYAYRKAYPNCFFLKADIKADSLIGRQDLTVSSDGKFIAGLDASGSLFIYETEKGTSLLTARPSDIDSSDSSQEFIDAVFLDETRILLLSSTRISCWDISSGRLLWSAGFPDSEFGKTTVSWTICSGMTVTQDRNHVYMMTAVRSASITMYGYDCRNGELSAYQRWEADTTGSVGSLISSPTELVLSPDEKTALLGTADMLYSQEDDYDSNLFVISLDTMELRGYHCAFPSVISLCFNGDSEAAVLSAAVQENINKGYINTSDRMFDYCLEMIRLADMTPVWTSKDSAIGLYEPDFRILPDPAASIGGCLLAVFGNNLIFTENATGEERDAEIFSAHIIDVERFSTDRLMVCLADGSIYQIVEDNGSPSTIFRLLEASGTYSAAYKKPSSDYECEYFLKDAFGNGVMVASNTAEDPSYTELDLSSYAASVPDPSSYYYAAYLMQNDKIWRCLYFAGRLLLYRPLTDTPAASVSVGSLESLPGFKEGEDAPVLYFTDSDTLKAVNLDTSAELFSRKLPAPDSYDGWDCLGWLGDTIIFFDRTYDRIEGPYLYLFDTRTLKETPVYAPESGARVKEAAVNSQRGFIAAVIDQSYEYGKEPESASLWFYDISTGSWRRSKESSSLGMQTDYLSQFDRDGTMALSPDGRTLALVSSGNIVIMDTVSDTVVEKLDVSCLQHCLMKFIDDKKLAVWDDTYYVSVWDTAERTMLFRTAQEHRRGAGFVGDQLSSIEGSFLEVYYCNYGSMNKTAIYAMDESDRMYFYQSIENAIMAPREEEILYINTYGREVHAGYYKPYTLDELIRRGHELIGGS